MRHSCRLFLITIGLLPLLASCSIYLKSDGRVYRRYANEASGFGKNEIKGIDYETFEELDDEFAYDKNHVYHHLDILQGADAGTFSIINKSKGYYKDKSTVYFFGFGGSNNIIEGAEPATFKVTSTLPWSYDSKNAFWTHKKLIPEPSSNFKPINERWAKDDIKFYYENFAVDSADRESFKVLDKSYAKDKFHVFFGNKSIQNCPPEEFISTGQFGGHDNTYYYYFGRRKELFSEYEARLKQFRKQLNSPKW